MTAWRRRALGNEWVRRAYANKTAFNEEFQELITRYAWGWTRPHYDERTRCVLMIGTPAAGRIPVRASIKECGFNEANIKAINCSRRSVVVCRPPITPSRKPPR